jgi:hypothetical protein
MADVGEMYRQGLSSFGHNLAEGIKDYQTRYERDKAMLDTVQGYLDVAKKLQVPDPKTGKPKNFFSDEQLNTVQQLIKERKAYQAGATASALGIGKGLIQRAAAASQSPFISHDNRRYLLNPKTGAVKPDTAQQRDQFGETRATQFNQKFRLNQSEQRALAAKQKGVDEMLKPYKLTRGDLFDTAKVQPGTLDKDGTFTPFTPPSAQPNAPKGGPSFANIFGGLAPTDLPMSDEGSQSSDTSTPAPKQAKPTHVLVGYTPPTYVPEMKAGSDGSPVPTGKYKITNKGTPGTVLSNDQYQSLQDSVAEAGHPIPSMGADGKPFFQNPTSALGWLRKPGNIENDPQMAERTRQTLVRSVTGAGAGTVQAQPEVNVEQLPDSGSTNVDTTDTQDSGDE